MAEMDVDASSHIQKYVGIDLSACNVVVACSSKDEPSAVTVAVNDVSNRGTPAAVAFDGKLRLVGESAETKVSQLPKQVVTSLPAMLGSKEAARANYDRLGCQWNFTDGGKVGPMAYGNKDGLELPPCACLSALLQKLVGFAAELPAAEPGQELPKQSFELAVAVPDGWADAELGALRASLDILGWEVGQVKVLPYSAALATAYAQRLGQKLPEGEERRVVAFADLGYSQSTVSIIAVSPPSEEGQELTIEVLGKAVAPDLGTQSLYSAMAEHVNKQVSQQGKEPVKLASKRGARLLAALQKSVKELSMLPEATLALECFFTDDSDLKVDLRQAQFEEIVQAEFLRFAGLAKSAMEESGLKAEDVHSVEMVGGGVRIPKVKQLLSDLFPSAADEEGEADAADKDLSKKLRNSLDGASAIATGAAHYAAGRRQLAAKWDLVAQASVLSADELAACREQEAWIASTNMEEVLRLEKGNELEAYIYEVRSWLSGPDRALLKPDVVEPVINQAFDWFEDAQYDEGTTLAMYEEKLSSLKAQLQENAAEYFEKKRKQQEEKDKFLDAEAEKERQRRQELGMDADKDDRKMAKSDRMKMAMKNKDEGNTVFKAGNLEDAAARYQRALQHMTKYFMLDVSPEEKVEANAVCLSVHLNMAQVYLKMAANVEKESGKNKAEAVWQKAKSSTEEALKVDENNVKARFRKASALEKLGDLDGAMKDVKLALKVDEANADLLKLKDRLDKLMAQQNAKAKKMYGKMFG